MQSVPTQITSLHWHFSQQNLMQCGTPEIPSSLNPKRDVRDEFLVPQAPEQGFLPLTEDLHSQSLSISFPLALSPQITCPLLS